jgi:hypothetical protein
MNAAVKKLCFFLFASIPYSFCSADIGEVGLQNAMSFLQLQTSQIVTNSVRNNPDPQGSEIDLPDDSKSVVTTFAPSAARTRANLAAFAQKSPRD